MVGIYLLLNLHCAPTNPVNKKEKIYYPLIDTRFKIHRYNENIQWLIFPKNEKKTKYCAIHFEWEDIKPIYRPAGNGEYRWQYRVTKNNGKPWK